MNNVIANIKITRQDIKRIMKENGYAGTDGEIDAVVKNCDLQNELECSICIDDIVEAEIRNAHLSGLISNGSPIEELAKLGIRLPMCGDCYHYNSEIGICSHYEDRISANRYIDGCGHFCSYGNIYSVVYDEEEYLDTAFACINDDFSKLNAVEVAAAISKFDPDDSALYADIIADPDYDPDLWKIEES